MILTINSFPPPASAFERLMQLHPAKAARSFTDFLTWACERRHFSSDVERAAHAAVRPLVATFLNAKSAGERAAAIIAMEGQYAAWREEMAIATLMAEGIDPVTCNQESA